MAVVTRYVNTASTAGGDGTTNGTAGATRAYATLAEWESAEQTNLVTATDTHIVNCSGSADDVKTTVTGWTTDATYFITINGDHTGTTWDTSAYIIDHTSTATSDYVCKISEAFTVVNDLQIQMEQDGQNGGAALLFDVDAESCTVNRSICHGHGTSTSTGCTGFKDANDSGTGVTYNNCLSMGFTDGGGTKGAGFDVTQADSALSTYNNCTSVYNANGFFMGSGDDANLYNCLATHNTDEDFAGTIAAGSDNAAGDGTAQGTGPIDTISDLTYVDNTIYTGDFSPKRGVTADDLVIRVGADLSGTFTDDLAGENRTPGTYTIGCLVAYSSGLLLTNRSIANFHGIRQ